MADKYVNFAALARAEAPDAFAIRVRNVQSKVVIAAPHGGAIEPGTSEVALALAGDDLSFYLFEGRKAEANAVLHITSTNFDEPQCLQLLATATVVITVHGECSADRIVFLGGRNIELMAAVRQSLTDSGFTVSAHSNPALQGRDPSNIANLGSAGAGVQLEISRGLRKRFFASLHTEGRTKPTPLLSEFSLAVRGALRNHGLRPIEPIGSVSAGFHANWPAANVK